ncbi:unnamed protein product [Closterium sp. NIES-53]
MVGRHLKKGKLAKHCPPPSAHLSLNPSTPAPLPFLQALDLTGAKLTLSALLHTAAATPPPAPIPFTAAPLYPLRSRDLFPITRCSSLTSLTLWSPESSSLSSLAFSSSSLASSSASSVASSPPSSLRTSLSSVTIHSAQLQGSLASLALFPSLSSLSLHSCTIDPNELHSFSRSLHSLSRSLHSLTHLTIHSCPLVSSRSLAPILQANPALSSLSLHSTTYRLFSAQGLRALLSRCSSQLRSLHLDGLPCVRPGLLADCRGLSSLSVEGAIDPPGQHLPQDVSLDGLVSMLVRVERIGVARGRAGGEAGREAGGEVGTEGWEKGNAGGSAATAAAAVSRIACRAAAGGSGRFVDFRTEAVAAQADKFAATQSAINFFDAAEEAIEIAQSDASWAACAEGEIVVARIAACLGNIRSGISACRSFCQAVRESKATFVWEERLMRAFVAAAAANSNAAAAADPNATIVAGQAAGLFSTKLRFGEEDGEEEGDDIRAMDAILAVDGLPESAPGGVRSGAVETREEVLGMLRPLTEELREQRVAVHESLHFLRHLNSSLGAATLPQPVLGAAAGEAAAGEAAAGDVAAGDVAAGEVAAGEATVGEATAGEAAAGEAAPKDGQISSRKASGEHPKGFQSAVPVHLFCPRLESLTLQALYFSPTPFFSWLPSKLPTASPLMYPSSLPPSTSCRSSSSSASCLFSPSPGPSPSIQPMSFQSIARAAVFGQLKRLVLVRCLGLEEQEWIQLLAACVRLKELKVQQNERFSDVVLTGSRLERLTSLTVVMCDKITASGIGEALGSFPRLRYLKVEVGKVSERARRELLRAGVVVWCVL